MRWFKAMLGVSAAVCLMLAMSLPADTLTLKDGTVVEGTLTRRPTAWVIKLPNGELKEYPLDDVKSISKGTAPVEPKVGNTPTTPGGPAGSADFEATKRKAETGNSVLAAVAAWQRYIDSNPSSPDLKQAEAEMEKWRKWSEEGAEKIKGKWVVGEERKAIINKAKAAYEEAMRLIEEKQTLGAVKKLDECNRIYPGQVNILIYLGYLAQASGKEDEAIRYLQMALAKDPNSVEALNNIGVAQVLKNDILEGTAKIHKAIKIRDSKEQAENLVSAIKAAPPKLQNSLKFEEFMATGELMSRRWGAGGGGFRLLLPKEPPKFEGDVLAGAAGSGSGFIVREDGLIVTNRHVVENGKSFLVILDGSKRVSADLLHVDKEFDLALLKIKAPGKYSSCKLAKADVPKQGSQAFPFGFPAPGLTGVSTKIAQGLVSSINPTELVPDTGATVVFDAFVNPGNSGGPLLDNNGNVIGVVTLKTQEAHNRDAKTGQVGAKVDSFGVAIPLANVRKMLAKNNVTLVGAEPDAKALSAEQVADKMRPSTVCVLSMP